MHLAVNQNGRWAPHFSYLRHTIREGYVGSVLDVTFSVHFDHEWIADSPFDNVKHVILYDFAIHWFDALSCFMGEREPRRVCASEAYSPVQDSSKPLLSQTLIEYEGAQASMTFAGHTRYTHEDRTFVAGTEGSLVSTDAEGDRQTLTLETEEGTASPELEGEWFNDGFHGSMAALLRSIETGREPPNSGRNNISSLELCFAAVASAERGESVVPGEVRKLPGAE